MKRLMTFVVSLMSIVLLCLFLSIACAYAADEADANEALSSSSLQSSEVDKDGNITYTIHCPTYKTANNRKWNSSTQKYYYTTDSINCKVIWRLYNPYSGEHLYSDDVNEYNYLGTVGWRQEDVAWIAPLTSNSKVYRLFNKYSGDHHYTTSLKEYNDLVKIGWTGENVGFYSDDAQGVTIWRLFNPYAKVGTHHYTISKDEYNYLGTHGWNRENVGWYGINHTSHTWVTVEYADESKTNSIRFAYFCPEHECEFLDDAHKWSSDGGYCPADKGCSKEKYVSAGLYVHKKVICTVCGAEK